MLVHRLLHRDRQTADKRRRSDGRDKVRRGIQITNCPTNRLTSIQSNIKLHEVCSILQHASVRNRTSCNEKQGTINFSSEISIQEITCSIFLLAYIHVYVCMYIYILQTSTFIGRKILKTLIFLIHYVLNISEYCKCPILTNVDMLTRSTIAMLRGTMAISVCLPTRF